MSEHHPFTFPVPAGQRRPRDEDIPALLEHVAEGKSLRSGCVRFGLHAPSTHAFIDDSPVWREQYARAREMRQQVHQEQAQEVALAAALRRKFDGQAVDPAGARVFLDAIKWTSAQMAPKTAPATKLELTLKDKSDEELRARLAELEGADVDESPDEG